MLLINNDIWLTQDLIAELFGVARSTITDHINNILKSGELKLPSEFPTKVLEEENQNYIILI